MTRHHAQRRRGPGSTLAVLALATMAVLSPDPAAGVDAADNWKKRCAMCHGKTGQPTPVGNKMGAKDVTSEEVQSKSDDAIATVVTDGSGKMPGFGDQMSAEEIRALVDHVRELARPED